MTDPEQQPDENEVPENDTQSEALEQAQEEAAEERQDEGGYQ